MMAKETVPAAGRRYSWESGTVRTRRSVRRTALSDVARSAGAASILSYSESESSKYIMGNPVSTSYRMSCMIDYGGPDAESLRHLKRRPSSRESDTTLPGGRAVRVPCIPCGAPQLCTFTLSCACSFMLGAWNHRYHCFFMNSLS